MTNREYQRLQQIFQELSRAESRFELLKIWHRHRNQLTDCRLLIANSNDDPFQLRAVFSHSSLKPLFAGESFIFLDNSSVHYHNSGEFQPISLDPCIVLDTNLIAQINGFINGKPVNKTKDILEFVMTKPFYYGFYAIEEYENYISGQNHFQIKQKLKAVRLFEHINEEKYRSSLGQEIDFQISLQEASNWAEKKFFEMFSAQSLPYLVNLKNAIYLLLLKVSEIELSSKNTRLDAETKILKLYDFMQTVLKILLGKEIYLITMYFEKNAELRNNGSSFFDPLQTSNKKLLQDLNGMARDLTILRTIERMPDLSNQADILLPYFVSRDERLNHVCDLLPKISKIFFYDKEEGSKFMSEWENRHTIMSEMQSKPYWKKIRWFYEPDAQQQREKAQHEDSQVQNLEFVANIRELEGAVESLLQ